MEKTPHKINLKFWQWQWEYKLIAILLIYALISVGYQATEVWREKRWGTYRVNYQLDGEYNLSIRLPKKIPIEIAGKPGHPLVTWLSQDPSLLSAQGTITPTQVKTDENCKSLPTMLSDTTSVTATWQVLFYPTKDQLIFTDEKGHERTSAITVTPGATQPTALRQLLYISRPLERLSTERATLCIQVWKNGVQQTLKALPGSGLSNGIDVELETRWQATLQQICNILFSTPALTWVTTSTAAFGLWKKERERRQEEKARLQEQIEALRKIPLAQAWRTYWRLQEEVPESLQQALLKMWQDIEHTHSRYNLSRVIRLWLIDQLTSSSEYYSWEKLRNSQKVLSKYEVEILRKAFNSNEEGETMSEGKSFWDDTLKAFQVLGMESARSIIIPKLKKGEIPKGTLEILKERWYKKGGAAGRYLLQTWARSNSILRDQFEEWKEEELLPATTCQGVCTLESTLWPSLTSEHKERLRELSLSNDLGIDQVEGTKIEEKFTPFGPLKAEEDPRLLPTEQENTKLRGWFWKGTDLLLPWIDEITANRHCTFYAPHGCGRTASIWWNRYKHRVSSWKPALSLYFELHHPLKSSDEILHISTNVLATSLSCALVEDPYWLLSADWKVQEHITALLLHWAGGHRALLRNFRIRGLPIVLEESKQGKMSSQAYDGQLLTELFHRFDPLNKVQWEDLITAVEMTREAVNNARPAIFFENWSYPTFLWIDIQVQVESELEEIMKLLWHKAPLRRLGYVKLFVSREISANSEVPIPMEWTKDALKAMIKYRFKKAGISENAWHTAFDGFQGGEEDIIRKLTLRASTPMDVIRNGNILLERGIDALGETSEE
jgi:hypothetical protein